MTAKIELSVEASADIRISISDTAPEDLFTRAEAEDFQRSLYGDAVADREGVLKHWAYNAIFNGVHDPSRLDGWADLEPGMVTMHAVSGDIDESYER